MLLEVVETHPVAERRCADVPLHGMAGRPAAEGLRADVERRLDAAARVVPRATHAAQLPTGPEVAGAHLRIGLEAAAGQHHGLRGNLFVAGGPPSPDPADRAVGRPQQIAHLGRVTHLDTALFGALE